MSFFPWYLLRKQEYRVCWACVVGEEDVRFDRPTARLLESLFEIMRESLSEMVD